MKLHRTFAQLLAFSIVLIGGADLARATFLSDLLAPGATIQVGDLLFSNFTYQQTGDMPAADAVNVSPFTAITGDNGLMFQGAFADMPGGSGSDALVGYNVSSITPGVSISGASLAGVPTVFGGTGVMSVTESFLPTNPSDIFSIYGISPGSTITNATATFASPFTSLNVQDGVLALASSGLPGLSFFTPTFHTMAVPIPEPASVTLVGMAVATLAWRRVRRKK
jgi:hypothetical protein